MNISAIQKAIQSADVDAWVMYDFRGSNDLAWTMASLPSDAHCTRRWVIVVPAKGKAVKIVHRMERIPLSDIKADERVYSTRQEYQAVLQDVLKDFDVVAMEYSPKNAIPVVSKVDAGTIELVRSMGVEVKSSADLVQKFTAVLSTSQLAGAAVTGGIVRDGIHEGFKLIRERLLDNEGVTEYEVQQHILSYFKERGLVTDTHPIVAIGTNASSPHYAPSILSSSAIKRDMVVVIDAWAKNDDPQAVYGDLTWVGYTGSEVPADVERSFSLIANARDAALELVKTRFTNNEPVFGYEVDRAARNVIENAGMGSAFIHRTGHNITTEIHGPGVNMDDFETHDDRTILPGMSFSIEPGVYVEGGLGMRTEIDVVISHDGEVSVPSSPIQTAVHPLLADDWTA